MLWPRRAQNGCGDESEIAGVEPARMLRGSAPATRANTDQVRRLKPRSADRGGRPAGRSDDRSTFPNSSTNSQIGQGLATITSSSKTSLTLNAIGQAVKTTLIELSQLQYERDSARFERTE